MGEYVRELYAVRALAGVALTAGAALWVDRVLFQPWLARGLLVPVTLCVLAALWIWRGSPSNRTKDRLMLWMAGLNLICWMVVVAVWLAVSERPSLSKDAVGLIFVSGIVAVLFLYQFQLPRPK